MTCLLEVKALTAFYGPIRVLEGIDLVVPQGGITTVLGANGAGKTTTLRAISGAVRTGGEIWFDGARIDRLSIEQRAGRGIAHVPDGHGTLTAFTVEENLAIGAYTRRDRMGAARDLERVLTYFPRLRERFRQQAGTLSGGEQQMLAIGRALMLRPKLLLMDEPSFGLAPLIIRDIFGIMATINRDDGIGILLVEQNVSRALALAEEAYLLETGRIVRSGPCQMLREDDGIRQSYLGY